MNRASYLFLPLIYLLLGGSVTAMLVRHLLQVDEIGWLWIYLPMILITLFVTVMGIVNVWIHYRTWNDDDRMVQQIYTTRRMVWLYFKCWIVVVAGLMLAMIFFWMQDFIPANLAPLFDEFRLAFYVIGTLLTAMALLSIVHGENLAEVRLRQSQNENLLLRSQLNPHFLYNTLNNIDALIWIDQERASSSVSSLSSLMRYFTYSSRQDFTTAGEEAGHLTQLIELHRLRMPSDRSLTFVCDIDNPDQQMAPLLLIPLVENCFKHCGDLNDPDAIRLKLEIRDGRLHFESDNNLPSGPEPAGKVRGRHGLGQKVMLRRLQLLYPHHHTLVCGRQGNRYKTELKIKL